MSKPSRRHQPPGSRLGGPAPTTGATPTPGAAPSSGTSHRPDATARPSTSPSGSARAGRRERARAAYKPTFTERYRTPIVVVAAIAAVVLVSAFVFASAASPAYACSTVWTASPTPSPAAGEPAELGYVQPDMGRRHAANGEKVTYTYCPPASGSHYNAVGTGPIAPRVYGPDDRALPQGWVHNLEHGAMVILYRGREGDPGPTEAGQAALRALFDAFPPSPVCGIQPGTSQGPVIARFDEMDTPYAAMVWGRVLPLDTVDTEQILAFWQEWGERTNPEAQCQPPSPAPSTAPSPATSPETSPAASPS